MEEWERLEQLLKENNVYIPRMRGVESMSNATLMTEDEIKEEQDFYVGRIIDDLVHAIPAWNGKGGYEYSISKDKSAAKYITRDPDNCFVITDIRWDRIKGKHKKTAKFRIKKKFKAIKRYAEVWNKYVGREDVIAVRARIGGWNWAYYDGHEIEKKPWFLERVDSYFDSTYCLIFVKVEQPNMLHEWWYERSLNE